MSSPETFTPWSSQAPQKYFLALLTVVIGVAVTVAAIFYIGDGVGGFVPFIMLLAGPALTVVYIYVFLFKKWDEA